MLTKEVYIMLNFPEKTNGPFPPVQAYTQAQFTSDDIHTSSSTIEPLPREYGFDVPSLDAIKTMADHLSSIKDILFDLHEYLKTKIYPAESQDIFKIVTLYKVGFGSNFIADKLGRMFIYVYALQTTNIIVTSPLASPTSATIPAGKWVNLNFPDSTSFILDAIATANQLNIYARYTMDSFNNDGPTVP